ncbi:M24 family metallopeptidase [Prauserella flavalba]|uniref:M24 family metallopeptidase n=1 Tax=Prauserella flavalba TaxID=1477506 RepID=UPI0036E0983F
MSFAGPESLNHANVPRPPTWLPSGWRPQTVVDPAYVAELRSRQARLREAFGTLDGVATVEQPHLRYLTGYSTIAPGKAALLVTAEGAYLAVSESELGRALSACAVDEIHVFGWDEPVDVEGWLRKAEYSSTLDRVLCEWNGTVLGHNSSADERVVGGVIDKLRFETSEWEAARMRGAARATKAGVEAALAQAGSRAATDATIAAAAITAMIDDSGYECPPVTVVGIDEGAGIAHSQWGRRRLTPGSVAFLEFSGGFDGYCAPVMRTIVREPVKDDVRFLFGKVEAILDILHQEVRPGARCSDVAAKCTRELVDVSGVLFHYNYGYPVGIFDGTPLWMNGTEFYITENNDAVFRPGMTFHHPISLRRFGQYAVGQSQTVRVTDSGVEVLTSDVPAGLLRA